MLSEELENLVLANHILHYQNVLDAYGHISVRHPDKPDVFIMSGDRAPALVESPKDLIEYYVKDASPVNPNAKKGYLERFIHSEVFKRFPEINSVIHSHSEAVLPYTLFTTPMKATFHIPGFLGTDVPVFHMKPLYKPGQSQDMLINSQYFGAALAAKFTSSSSEQDSKDGSLDHKVVLQAQHGFTAVGTSIKQAVYRAVYTQVNARVQTNAIMLGSAAGSKEGPIYLDKEQAKGSLVMNEASQNRPWELWVREVEICPLYRREK